MTMAVASTLLRLALGVAANLVASAALAQGSVSYASVEATPDNPVQLSYHASAHRGDCSAAPAPTVRVSESPKEGALVVREGVLTTDKVAGCPQLKVPAEVVFYEARGGYTGPDHVAYQVTDEKGQVARYDVTITVEQGTSSSTPSEASQPGEPEASKPTEPAQTAPSKPGEPGSGSQ